MATIDQLVSQSSMASDGPWLVDDANDSHAYLTMNADTMGLFIAMVYPAASLGGFP